MGYSTYYINAHGFIISYKSNDYTQYTSVEIPKKILEEVSIATVKTVDEVLKIALTKELKPVEWIEVEKIPKTKGTETPVTGLN